MDLYVLAMMFVGAAGPGADWQCEDLGRGVIALRGDDGSVYVGWRLLASDRPDVAFHLYRSLDSSTEAGPPVRCNAAPIVATTDFVDRHAPPGRSYRYRLKTMLDGKETDEGGYTLSAQAPRPYMAIDVDLPPGYAPNDGSAGDLDGDGEYELVVHQAAPGSDNARPAFTDEPLLDAYRLDGSRLWRIHLGINIREGAHYTQFMVYDLDGDGRAEVATKTADGSRDAAGAPIGNASADWRDPRGYILDGPEYLTVFDGLSGRAQATVPYVVPRGRVGSWGDDYGNRVDRFLAAIAYLDGRRPSLITCRGYYARSTVTAWDYRAGRLTRRWTFDSDDGTAGHAAYRGQGNHNLAVGDVDGDGRDEIVYGACAIDDDGRGLYTTGLGHGDALHLSDIDPDRPGLEVFGIHERPRHPYAAALLDAATGRLLWGKPAADAGRGVAFDVDPRYRGYELWAAGPGLDTMWTARGEPIGPRPRSVNFGVWWDADRLRELLDGVRITKWDWLNHRERLLMEAAECVANNGSKSTPVLAADIVGDWREEVVWRTRDNRQLRIYSTCVPAVDRRTTLMHDRVYRLSVAWQNVAYNQPAQPGYYLGEP